MTDLREAAEAVCHAWKYSQTGMSGSIAALRAALDAQPVSGAEQPGVTTHVAPSAPGAGSGQPFDAGSAQLPPNSSRVPPSGSAFGSGELCAPPRGVTVEEVAQVVNRWDALRLKWRERAVEEMIPLIERAREAGRAQGIEEGAAVCRRRAAGMINNSRGGLGGMFASQSSTDLCAAADEIRSLAVQPADDGWRPIETAPLDPNLWVWVYAAPREELPGFVTICRWHTHAGWTVDELREVTHWQPAHMPAPPKGGEG